MQEALSSDTPTLVRIDVTYGSGAASQWLYRLLQPTFMFLGVNSDRFPKEMVYDLACTIAGNPIYNKLTLAEVMLFISRFKGGMYGRFYGDTSYALAVTEGLYRFMEERGDIYAQMNRDKEKEQEADYKKKAVSFKEWKARQEAAGEEVHIAEVETMDRNGRNVRAIRPVETLKEQAGITEERWRSNNHDE